MRCLDLWNCWFGTLSGVSDPIQWCDWRKSPFTDSGTGQVILLLHRERDLQLGLENSSARNVFSTPCLFQLLPILVAIAPPFLSTILISWRSQKRFPRILWVKATIFFLKWNSKVIQKVGKMYRHEGDYFED